MDPNSLIEAARRKREEEQQAELDREQAEKDFTTEQFRSVITAMAEMTKVLMDFVKQQEIKTNITNFPKEIGTPDVDKVVKAVKSLEKSLKPQTIDNSDVITALQAVKDAVSAIPTMPEAIEVSNMDKVSSELKSGLRDVLKRLEKLEFSPKITVPKPTVTVQPTDVKGIVKELKAVKQEIIDKPVPGTPTFVQDPLIRFAPVDIDDAGLVQYFGFIATDGEFYIREYDTSGAYKTLRFYFSTGGTSAYQTAWTNRASLTYSMWSD